MSNDQPRNLPVYACVLLALAGVILIVVSVIYFAEPAKSLPSFFPGHQSGSNHHHTTHGIAALIVGLIGIFGAWMGAGRKKIAHQPPLG